MRLCVRGNPIQISVRLGRARLNLDAPFADMVRQSLAPTINQVQGWSEDTFGVGGSTVLGATGELTLDTLSLVGAGAGARRFLPELDVALSSDARFLRSSDLGMGIEKASPELVDRIAGKRTVLFAVKDFMIRHQRMLGLSD